MFRQKPSVSKHGLGISLWLLWWRALTVRASFLPGSWSLWSSCSGCLWWAYTSSERILEFAGFMFRSHSSVTERVRQAESGPRQNWTQNHSFYFTGKRKERTKLMNTNRPTEAVSQRLFVRSWAWPLTSLELSIQVFSLTPFFKFIWNNVSHITHCF